MKFHWVLFLLTSLIGCASPALRAQETSPYFNYQSTDSLDADINHYITFGAYLGQTGGFDGYTPGKSIDQYEVIRGPYGFNYAVPFKSLSTQGADLVCAFLQTDSSHLPNLSFRIQGEETVLEYLHLSDTTYLLLLPPRDFNYYVYAFDGNSRIGKLRVLSYPKLTQKITLVPLVSLSADSTQLRHALNRIFQGANLDIELRIAPRFAPPGYSAETAFEYPDDPLHLSYTGQMTQLERVYGPKLALNSNEYVFFVIGGFENPVARGYMGIGNHLGFVVADSLPAFSAAIARELGHGIGFLPYTEPPADPTDPNLMHGSGTDLLYAQWEQLRKNEWASYTWIEGPNLTSTAGLVAYYFWEENVDGSIRDTSIRRPFRYNHFITLLASRNQPRNYQTFERVEAAVIEMANDNKYTERNYFEMVPPLEGGPHKLYFPLHKTDAPASGSIIYRRQNGGWKSIRQGSVIYLNVFDDSLSKFSHSNDSIILDKYNIRILSNGHYIVKTYWKNNGKIARQLVFNYNNDDVTAFFLKPERILPKRVIVFANGYRGPKKDKDVSDNLVTTRDRYHYWMKIDKEFIKRLKPAAQYYIDGSHKIGTSGHKTMVRFGLSLVQARTATNHERSRNAYKILNTDTNLEGFKQRKEKGRIAARAFLNARCNSPGCLNTKDTVDIVCHSMGYAYTLGFIEELKGKVIFGKIYILAPENACIDGTDWSLFEEVWQYGSNLDQPDPDPVWEQDGIAPQCQVLGLEQVPAGKGGRAFIPKDWPHKNFIDSHMLYHFEWIFERIQPGQPGYIQPRKG
jgi:hypothetical protein